MASPAAAGGSSSPFKVAILATSTHDQATKKPYTLYTMSVHYTVPEALRGGESTTVLDWTVGHRYSDFEALRAKLAELSTQVPSLPGKSWFGSLSAELVASRKAGLTTFLQECQQRPWILARPEFLDFVQVAENVPAHLRYAWQPKVIKEVRNLNAAGATDTFGANDALYLEQPLVLLLGMEEQRMLTKVDNVLSQVRMPWEKKTLQLPRPQPLGTFRIHKVDPATGDWRLTCSISTDVGVVCLAFEEDTRVLWSGMDDGAVLAHRISADWADAEQIKELRNLHEAKSRVTALALHRQKHYLLSVSRDKHLAVYDIRKDLVLSTTAVGASVNAGAWISALEIDEGSELAFLGTYATFIHIVDIANATNPRLLHTLEGHTGSVRCLQYRPAERLLLSGGFDGHAALWNINNQSREAVLRSRSVGWLREAANEKVKSVAFLPPVPGSASGEDGSQGLVAVGQDGGFLSFFSVATGRMLFALKAHQNNVVKLVYLEGAQVLISAGLDGAVKFWSIPAQRSVAGEKPLLAQAVDAVQGAMQQASISASSASAAASSAVAAASLFFKPSNSASASSSNAGPRKDSSFGPSAPPPSVAGAHSVLHKSSRADSADSSTFSTSVPTHGAGLQEEEEEEFVPGEGQAAPQSGSSRAEVLGSPPAIPEEHAAGDAVEVPGDQEEADIF